MEKLIQFLTELQTDKKFKNFDEASIKQGIILKVLSLLGWDPFDLSEIQPEFSIKKQKIDFVLKQDDSPQFFLIVKKDISNFKAHIETLLEISETSDIKIAIYTNGFSWCFFLPSAEGSIDDKRFWVIDTDRDKAELIAKRLYDFISKESVLNDNGVKLAKEIINKRKEKALINEHLPKAWEKIINEPEKYLVDVIMEVTKGLCGYKPKREKVMEFVKAERNIRLSNSADKEISAQPVPTEKKHPNWYKGKNIKSFYFEGNEYSIKTWQDLPWTLCIHIIKKHKDSFNNVLYISLKGRDFFSNDPHQFISNKEIPGTGIYLNTDFSEVIAVALCNEILNFFGYKEKDLVINTKK